MSGFEIQSEGIVGGQERDDMTVDEALYGGLFPEIGEEFMHEGAEERSPPHIFRPGIFSSFEDQDLNPCPGHGVSGSTSCRTGTDYNGIKFLHS